MSRTAGEAVAWSIECVVLPEETVLLQLVEFVTEVTVIVVLPAFDKLPASIENVPLPGLPAVNDIAEVRPVAVLAPLKS